MTALCDLARNNAKWVWGKLRESRTYSSRIGEESITDFLILEFKKHEGPDFFVQSFTRPQEKLTGADWEWWLSGPSGRWIGIRVQAKSISLTGIEYPQLHYKRKDGTFQIDQLVADAAKHKAIPCYCLYSNWDTKRFPTKAWTCGTYPKNTRLLGAALVATSAIRALHRSNERRLKHVMPHQTPMHCLFCCVGYVAPQAPADLPHRAASFLRARGFVDGDEGEYLLDQPPYYVAQLTERKAEYDLVDMPDGNLRSVTVFREREGEI